MIFGSNKKPNEPIQSQNPNSKEINRSPVGNFVSSEEKQNISSHNNLQVEITFAEDGEIKKTIMDPYSLDLRNGEELLWSFDITEGLIRKKIVVRLALSNYRIMKIDMQNNKILGYILLQDLDDVVVMNTHRASNSIGYGMYAGTRGRYMTMAGPRFSSGTSKTIGDIVFIVNGQKVSWGGLPDPTGLKNFVKSLKKTMYDEVKKLEKKPSRSGISCPQCDKNNPKENKFCNWCGKKFEFICNQCGNTNPTGSSFCSQCGFILQ